MRSSSAANRRSATSRTRNGVIISATTSNETTTITGVTVNITIKGARKILMRPKPTLSSQAHPLLTNADDSSTRRTWSSASSQYRYPRPSVSPTTSISGNRDIITTRGRRQ